MLPHGGFYLEAPPSRGPHLKRHEFGAQSHILQQFVEGKGVRCHLAPAWLPVASVSLPASDHVDVPASLALAQPLGRSSLSHRNWAEQALALKDKRWSYVAISRDEQAAFGLMVL